MGFNMRSIYAIGFYFANSQMQSHKIAHDNFTNETQRSQIYDRNYFESNVDGLMPNATLKRTIVSSAGEK